MRLGHTASNTTQQRLPSGGADTAYHPQVRSFARIYGCVNLRPNVPERFDPVNAGAAQDLCPKRRKQSRGGGLRRYIANAGSCAT